MSDLHIDFEDKIKCKQKKESDIIVKMPTVLIVTAMTVLSIECTVFHKVRPIPELDHKFLSSENSITYIGHATVLIHLESVNVITDPIFSNYIGLFTKRYIEPGIKIEKLPALDAILISHEHNDHLDKPSLKKFQKDIPVIISKGLGERIRKLGFNDVRELSWWESTRIKNLRITATPAKHILSKSSSYVIEGPATVFFAGDTGLSDRFKEIGQRFKIDVAVLPVGDYHPRLWFIPGFSKMTRARHMAPGDIPDAIKMLRTRMVIPIHWGTFKISGTGLNAPVEWLKKIINENKLEGEVFILNHGETKSFYSRT